MPSGEPGAPAAGASQASAQAVGRAGPQHQLPCHLPNLAILPHLHWETASSFRSGGRCSLGTGVCPGPSWRCQTGAERVTACSPVIHGSLSRTCGCTRGMGHQKTLLRPAQAAGAV